MRHATRKIRRFPREATLTSAILLTLVSTVALAGPPTLHELLKKVDDVLAPPVRLRIKSMGVETTVTRTVLPNGEPASRTEAVAPSQTIVLEIGGKYYEILPQSRVIIDKNKLALRESTKAYLRTNELSLFFVPDLPQDTDIASRQLTSVTRGGKQFHEIVTQLSTPLLTSTSHLPGVLRSGIRASQSILIDKSTLEPVEIADLSPSGTVISRFQFIEISRASDLPEGLFGLPADYTVKTPLTMNEYSDIHEQLWGDLTPPPKWRPKFPRPKDPPRISITVDPKTGFPIRLGKTVEQVKEDVANKLKEMADSRPVEIRESTWVLVYGNLSLVLAITLVVLIRRPRKGDSKARTQQ